MRTFFRIVSLLSIVSVLGFMVSIIAISISVEQNTVADLNWNFMMPLLCVCGIVIMIGSAVNLTIALNDNVWKEENELIDEKKKVSEAIKKFDDARDKLVDYVLKQTK